VSLKGVLSGLSFVGVDTAVTCGQLEVSLRSTPLRFRELRSGADAGSDGDAASVGDEDEDAAVGTFAAICSFLTAQKLGVDPCDGLRPLRRLP
jgi:hypothetical protein